MKKSNFLKSSEKSMTTKQLNIIDNMFGKIPPYQAGKKAGKKASGWIDLLIDIIFPKK